MTKRKQVIVERNYLDIIFNENDYMSPEESAINNIEQLPDDINEIIPFSRRKAIRYEDFNP